MVAVILQNIGTEPITLSSSGVFTQTSPYVADQSTVLLMHIDEGSGSTTADSSQNVLTGTLLPGGSEPAWTSGKFGNALAFESALNNYVSLPSDPSLDPAVGSTDLTIEAWVKTDMDPTTSNYPVILSRHSLFSLGYFLGLNIDSPDDGESEATILLNSVSTSSSSTVTDDVWHHIAGVLTFTGGSWSREVFVDGVSVGSGLPTGIATVVGEEFRIGGDPGMSPSSSSLSGLIDEVRVSTVARSFAASAQGWNYECDPVVGNTVRCGAIEVEKDGTTLYPGFKEAVVNPGETVKFEDTCTGTCHYKFFTNSGPLGASALCN